MSSAGTAESTRFRRQDAEIIVKEDHADDLMLFDTAQGRLVRIAGSLPKGTAWSCEP